MSMIEKIIKVMKITFMKNMKRLTKNSLFHICNMIQQDWKYKVCKTLNQKVIPDKYSEIPLISDFQNFHKISLGVPKKNFISKKISPIPPPYPEYQKKIFLKKILYSWEKIMILIEMFRGTMALSTRIFAQFFTPKGR